ncbi:MAG: bifunctional 4-hydroxy-2-oxoglutarate aldolase/2-dehydro-3-deoxy-phosphogluconate aldolase [Winogradskyella sp.]|uniref:bifunctional 4-hydroxy-2-oxoglutarate aldolase/2-dehydro-3-deoxy-phosphogluconate aldolase n=1 Tax=Winogradskyella sp. TaxID=1883156 RepID=UPI0038580957
MVNTKLFSWKLYHQAPIVGIVRNLPIDTVLKIAQAYSEAGLNTIEITMNTKSASEIIATLRHKFPNLNVGAGTVCTDDDLDKAIDAGAQFIVTPIINEAIIKKTVALNIPVFPGAFTPTEIYKAWSLGASAVKVFPATQLGVSYIKDVLAPLNKIKLLPTGGITEGNIKSFFEAGAVGVGMGSSLISKTHISNDDYEGLKKHFIKIRSQIEEFVQI